MGHLLGSLFFDRPGRSPGLARITWRGALVEIRLAKHRPTGRLEN
jgi:hypothetical protein